MTKILLVEDDKSLREIYGVRLLAEGYDIVSAGDGEEALAMAIKERPNLIVSDVMMPKISGFDMLDILRSTTETKDIKVIMMTALSSEDQRQRGEKLGADRYLVKSQVGIEDVVRTVHEVLGDLPGMTSAAQAPSAAQPVATPSPTAPMSQQPMPQSQPVSMPAATQSPAASAPTAPQPQAPESAPQVQGSSLPQPTAPFSSPVPRPTSLGDRVLQPLPQSGESSDIASMLADELNDMPNPAAPVAPSAPAPDLEPAAPHPIAQPVAPTHQPQAMPPLHQQQPQPDPSFAEPIQRPDIASLSPQPAAIPQPQQQPAPITGIPTAMPTNPTAMDQAGPAASSAPVADVNPINPQAPQQ